MDLEQLRTLAAVVDEGTLDRAAVVLHVSAPAVSQRIKALEAQTGHVLVRRSVPVTVTEPGRTVLRLARQVLDLRDAARAELGMTTSQGAPTRSELRLAINADSLATWFRPVLAELGAGEHAMTLRLRYEDQDHSRELLRAGEVAAAITASDQPAPGCRAVPLGTMIYDPVIAPSLLERHGSHPDLSRLPVVSFDDKDDLHTEQLHRAGITIGANGPPEHRVPSSEAYVRAVADGIGWGMVPRLQLPGAPFAAVDQPLERLEGLDSAVVPLHLQRWSTALPALDRLEAVLRARAPRWLAV